MEVFQGRVKVEERVEYCIFLLVGFLCYVVGVGLTDNTYQYVYFVLILLLLCLFGHSLNVGLVTFH